MFRVFGRNWIAVAAFALTALPLSQVHAQNSAPAWSPGSDAEIARVAALRAQATEMMTDESRYRDAARLLEQAAALTPAGEPARPDDLHLAANLLYFAGAVRDAQAVMVKAANAALTQGDIMLAAGSLMDAGWLAERRHNSGEARKLALPPLGLTDSPLLSDNQRDAIRHRIVEADPRDPSSVSYEGAARTGWSVAAERAISNPRRL